MRRYCCLVAIVIVIKWTSGACSTNDRSTGQLLNTLRLKARAFYDGSNFDADPHELQVTWRSVYNDVVWLYESYLWIEMYL